MSRLYLGVPAGLAGLAGRVVPENRFAGGKAHAYVKCVKAGLYVSLPVSLPVGLCHYSPICLLMTVPAC